MEPAQIAVTRLVEALIYPPAGPLLLGVVGVLLARRRPRLGAGVAGVAWLTLYLLSIPAVTGLLAAWLERTPPATPDAVVAQGAEAIVVLGYERYHGAPEYGGDTSGGGELERLRYAAYLHRHTGLPVAVVGGDPMGTGTAGADLMGAVLEQEWGVPVRWRDGRSRNTFDNARYAADVLRPAGIERVALVTHVWHMPRSRRAFADQGLKVVAAPTDYYRPGPLERGLWAWLPRADSLEQNNRYLHELAGMLWYAWFY